MTYLRFHLLFNLPLSLVLFGLTRGTWSVAEGVTAALVASAAVLFTSPWDNDAVRRGIWDFPPGRTGPRLGHLPWEEYLFFVWQTANVIGGVGLLLRLDASLRTFRETSLEAGNGMAALAVLVLWVMAGKWLKQRNLAARWNYARHLLYWFAPIIVLQWAIAPGLFVVLAPVIGLVTLCLGTYYALADWVAVRAGVWFFDPAQITGHKLGGILPWEEIAFFYLTSLLVAQSYLLLVPAEFR